MKTNRKDTIIKMLLFFYNAVSVALRVCLVTSDRVEKASFIVSYKLAFLFNLHLTPPLVDLNLKTLTGCISLLTGIQSPYYSTYDTGVL